MFQVLQSSLCVNIKLFQPKSSLAFLSSIFHLIFSVLLPHPNPASALYSVFVAFASAGCGCFDSPSEHLNLLFYLCAFFVFMHHQAFCTCHFPKGHVVGASVFIKD